MKAGDADDPVAGPTTSRRRALLLSYEGGDFAGWQLQRGRADVRTLQATLEEALAGVVGEPVRLHAAGRTDAGVHALGQVAHFDSACAMPAAGILHQLNRRLPDAVAVRACADVSPTFDARRDAIRRTYTYRLFLGHERATGLARRLVGCAPGRADVASMLAAAALLKGEHDFAGFRSALCTARRTRLSVERADLEPLDAATRAALALPEGPPAFLFTIACRSFLMHMVRRLMGTVVLAGLGKIPLERIAMCLASGEAPPHVLPMPPSGLALHRVDYPVDPFASGTAVAL